MAIFFIISRIKRIKENHILNIKINHVANCSLQRYFHIFYESLYMDYFTISNLYFKISKLFDINNDIKI